MVGWCEELCYFLLVVYLSLISSFYVLCRRGRCATRAFGLGRHTCETGKRYTSLKNTTEKWANLARDHLASLKEANTRVKSLKVDVLVNNLPKECYRGTRINIDYAHSVMKLIDAFSAGWSFLAIRA